MASKKKAPDDNVGVRKNFYLKKDLADRLDAWAISTDRSQSACVAKLIREHVPEKMG